MSVERYSENEIMASGKRKIGSVTNSLKILWSFADMIREE